MLLQSPITYAIQKDSCIYNSVCTHLNVIAFKHLRQRRFQDFFSRGGSKLFLQGRFQAFSSGGGSRLFLQGRFQDFSPGGVPGFYSRVSNFFLSRGSNFCPHHYRITIPFHIQAVCICFNKRYSRCGSDPRTPAGTAFVRGIHTVEFIR